MSEQLPLFETVGLGWKQRLWRRVGDEKREQVILLLAELAKPALEDRRTRTKGEKPHEQG